jgi:hypothetical protein
VVECPRIPAAYSQILNNLSQLKSQIRNDAHCEDVRLKTGELENLVRSDRRTRFLEIVRLNNDRTVSADDAEFLRKYAEDASETSLRLMTILRGKQSCFPDENQGASSLGAITSFVFEATSLLSRVAGPYGAPIAVGGNILTGVLQGIQAVQASRPGYRFHIARDRQAFTEQVCIYHNYRRDIDDVLFPDRRIGEIRRLQSILETRREAIKQNCQDCARIVERFTGSESEEESRRLAAELSPRAREIDSSLGSRLGSETLELVTSLAWARRETERLEQVRDVKLRSIGPQEVMFLKNDLDHFFFTSQAPNFLTWQTEQSFRADWQFRAHLAGVLSAFVARIAREKNERGPRVNHESPDASLNYVVENRSRLSADDLTLLESEILRSRDQFELAWSAWGVIEEYCNFFREARTLNRTLASGHCSRENMNNQRARLAPRQALLAMLEPSSWNNGDKAESSIFGDFSSGAVPRPAAAPGAARSRPLAANWIEALEAEQNAWRADTRRTPQ